MTERPKPNFEADLPPELIGSYSTWKKKDGSGEDSNRHTYLVDEQGKKQVISRAAFLDRFNPVRPGEATEPDLGLTGSGQEGRGLRGESENEQPNRSGGPIAVSGWVSFPQGGNPARDVHSRGATEVLASSSAGQRAAPAGYMWYTTLDSEGDPINRLVPEAAMGKEHKDKSRGLGRLGKLGKAVIKWSLGGALAVGAIIGTGEDIKDGEYDLMPSDRPIEIEATPIATPDDADYEIVEPPSTPEAAEVVEPSATPAGTPASDESSPVDLTGPEPEPEPELSDDTDTVEPPVADDEPEGDKVPSETTIEPISDEDGPESEVEPSDKESDVGAIEALMVSVEVAPGDGVTQVLAKVLNKAGYPDASPEQLFEMYEDLVTNPDIGPHAIFEGITLEYNPAVGEYWIQGEGGVETHLTEEAAEWLQSVAPGQ